MQLVGLFVLADAPSSACISKYTYILIILPMQDTRYAARRVQTMMKSHLGGNKDVWHFVLFAVYGQMADNINGRDVTRNHTQPATACGVEVSTKTTENRVATMNAPLFALSQPLHNLLDTTPQALCTCSCTDNTKQRQNQGVHCQHHRQSHHGSAHQQFVPFLTALYTLECNFAEANGTAIGNSVPMTYLDATAGLSPSESDMCSLPARRDPYPIRRTYGNGVLHRFRAFFRLRQGDVHIQSRTCA